MQYTKSIEKDASGSLGLRIAKRRDATYLIGLAERLKECGILIGDQIVSIGWHSIAGMQLSEVSNLMRSLPSPVAIALKSTGQDENGESRETILNKVKALNSAQTKFSSAIKKMGSVNMFHSLARSSDGSNESKTLATIDAERALPPSKTESTRSDAPTPVPNELANSVTNVVPEDVAVSKRNYVDGAVSEDQNKRSERSVSFATALEQSLKSGESENNDNSFNPLVDHWPVEKSVQPIQENPLIESLQSKIDTLKETHKQSQQLHDTEIKLKESKIDDLVAKIDNESAVRLRVEMSLKKARRGSVSLQLSNSNLLQQISSLETENDELSKKLRATQNQVAAEKERFFIMSQKYTALKNMFIALQEEMSPSRNIIAATESDVRDDEDTVASALSPAQPNGTKTRRVSRMEIENTSVTTTEAVRRLSVLITKRAFPNIEEPGVPRGGHMFGLSEVSEEQKEEEEDLWF